MTGELYFEMNQVMEFKYLVPPVSDVLFLRNTGFTSANSGGLLHCYKFRATVLILMGALSGMHF